MKKNVLIFGAILGAIMCANLFYMVYLCYNKPDFKSNAVVGYSIQIVIFSLIFFGIRNYRNKELGGLISLGEAFKTGALIALFASTLYVIIWLFYYYLFVPDFIDKYTAKVLRESAPADVAANTKAMAGLKESYQNPIMIVLITYMEVLPVGLLVAFISALILKKKATPVTA